MDYLDTIRNLGFLPRDPIQRAKAQALSHAIAVDLLPVCNLSVVAHATGKQDAARTDWMHHFISPGLAAFEDLLAGLDQSPFAIGDAPSLADICLIPQLYNANRGEWIMMGAPGSKLLKQYVHPILPLSPLHPSNR